MHRTDGANHSSNTFTEGPPGTQVTDDFMNDVQENLCVAIEAAPITLVKGTYTQLRDAIGLLAKTALRAAANTWAELQTFSKGVTVNQSVSNTTAGTFTGNGSAAGITGVGGATNAPGGSFTGGGTTGKGAVAASADANGVALEATTGHLKLSGALGIGYSPYTNTLTKQNIVKAFVTVECLGGGSYTIRDAFNITSVGSGTNTVVITLGGDMASANYGVVLTDLNPLAGTPHIYAVSTRGAGSFEVYCQQFGGGVFATVDLTASANYLFTAVVYGEQ